MRPATEDLAATKGPIAPSPWRRRASAAENAIGLVTESIAAILIVVETIILFCGTISRYVFESPLTWSDEVAGIMFLWLSVFGAIIALRRGGHMRLTILVNAGGGSFSRWLEPYAGFVIVLFLALMILPAIEHMRDEMVVRTSVLGLSFGWRTSAMVVGMILLLVLTIFRLFERPIDRHFLGPFAVVASVAVLLGCGRPIFEGLGYYNLVIFLVGLLFANVILGVPIAFAFGIATVSYLGLTTHIPLSVVVGRMESGMEHIVLLSVPLFIALGLLLEMTGMARTIIDFLASLLGHVRCGLSYVLLGAIFLVSGISGSKAADMAAVAPALFPEMKQRGYRPDELVAQLSMSCAMSEVIPPSLVLITLGSVTDVSMAALFTGGILPALLLCLALAGMARVRSRIDVAQVERASLAEIWKKFLIALPGIGLPFIIRFAVVEGVATATEVATIGIAYIIACSLLIYRDCDWRRLFPLLVETAALTGAILFIMGTATALGWALTQSGFSRNLILMMSDLPGGATIFLLASIIVFIVFGSLLEGIPALVLFAPLLFPIARMVGVHEVHYAMVIILAMGIGLFAPPLGIGYYTACAIGETNPDRAMGAVWPYLGVLIVALIVVATFPWLSICFL